MIARACVLAAVLSGCATTGTASQRWVLVEIESARISETLSSGGSWDQDTRAAQAEHDGQSREAVAGLLGLAHPALGALYSALSALSSSPPTADGPATYPDPFIRMTFNAPGASRVAESAVLLDTVRPSWSFSSYVTLDGLGDTGIDVEIRDFDQSSVTRIGGTNVPRAMLASVADAGEHRAVRVSDHELDELRLRIAPVSRTGAPSSGAFTLALREGLVSTGLRVPLNALVRVRVRGRGQVASGGAFSCASSGAVTPAGLRGSECRGYNLEHRELASAPHGSAIALLGSAGAVRAVSLARGTDPEPCVEFLAPAAGVLVLGVNDRDLGNDRGRFDFEVSVARPPDDLSTALAGATRGCDASGPPR